MQRETADSRFAYRKSAVMEAREKANNSSIEFVDEGAHPRLKQSILFRVIVGVLVLSVSCCRSPMAALTPAQVDDHISARGDNRNEQH